MARAALTPGSWSGIVSIWGRRTKSPICSRCGSCPTENDPLLPILHRSRWTIEGWSAGRSGSHITISERTAFACFRQSTDMVSSGTEVSLAEQPETRSRANETHESAIIIFRAKTVLMSPTGAHFPGHACLALGLRVLTTRCIFATRGNHRIWHYPNSLTRTQTFTLMDVAGCGVAHGLL
jgi:hypothetical protein